MLNSVMFLIFRHFLQLYDIKQYVCYYLLVPRSGKFINLMLSQFFKWLIREYVYNEKPKGFFINVKEDKVYNLKIALYGLKQAPSDVCNDTRS